MSNSVCWGVGLMLALAGNCLGQQVYPAQAGKQGTPGVAAADTRVSGEAYLLRIEELEVPAPRAEQIPGAAAIDFGWVDAGPGGFDAAGIGRRFELLVLVDSPFYLEIAHQGDVVRLSGRLTRSAALPARVVQLDATGQQPPQIADTQGEDFRVQVEYRRFNQDGRQAGVESSIPLRFGKRYLLAPGPRLDGGRQALPQTLWSIKEVTPGRERRGQ